MKRFILVLKLSVLVCAGKLLLIHPCGISCVLPEVKASLCQGTHWGGRGGGKQRRSKRRGWQPAGTTSPSILTSSQFFCRLMIHFFNKWDTIASFVLGCSHLQLIFSLKHLHHVSHVTEHTENHKAAYKNGVGFVQLGTVSSTAVGCQIHYGLHF